MRLADKIVETVVGAVDAVITSMPDSLEGLIRHPFESILDGMESVVIVPISPLLKRLEDSPTMPQGVRDLARDARESKHPWWAALLVPVAMMSFVPGMNAMLEPPSRLLQYEEDRSLHTARLDPHDAAIIELRDPLKQDVIESDLRDLGWTDERIHGFRLLAHQLVQPDQMRQLFLRGLPEYEAVKGDLAKAGYTPERIHALEALYWQLPGLGDMTEFARRLAFSPQSREYWPWAYDAPTDFVEAAKLIGLDPTWCEYYWFVHWQQPGVQLQFDMWHRGEIEEEDVRRTLWALGYSDWWIPHIMEVSHSLYTRVDVRRMYRVGILDREGVKHAYEQLGYASDKAEALTEFTIRYYPIEEETEDDRDRDYTKSEILDGYRKGLLEKQEAVDLLSEEGYQPDQLEFYLTREDYKAEVGLQDEYLKRYRTLFVEGLIDSQTAINNLEDLGIPATQTQAELPLWHLDKITRVSRPSRSDLARFLKAGIIDDFRWEHEMSLHGYNAEYIGWYRDELRD